MKQKGQWGQIMVPNMGTVVLSCLGDLETGRNDQTIPEGCPQDSRNDKSQGNAVSNLDLSHRQGKRAKKLKLDGQATSSNQPISETLQSTNSTRNDMPGMSDTREEKE